MNRKYDLAQLGYADLLTRDLGRKVFPTLEAELQQTSLGHTLILDSTEVLLMDSSFFDEAVLNLFAKLLKGDYGDRYLAVTAVSPDTLDNIEGSVARRKLQGAFPVMVAATNWRFVGNLEPNLRDTLEVHAKHKELTARDLADLLEISIYNASNRLRRLSEMRLLKRVEDIPSSRSSHRYQFLA
jgi:hypothetical protein